MGEVINPQPTNPSEIDLSWMAGRTITDVNFEEPAHWTFSFGDKGHISAECPWRILKQGYTILSSSDASDPSVEATKLLSAVVIDAAQLRVGTSDILIDFSEGLRLEILPISSVYEGWQMMDPFGTEFFAQGGGQICIWEGGR